MLFQRTNLLPQNSVGISTMLTTRSMRGLRVLVSSFQRRMFHLTLSQALAMTCAFLPILSSVLFASVLAPGVENLTIQQGSWFGVINGTDDTTI